jgi:hypothetical protein
VTTDQRVVAKQEIQEVESAHIKTFSEPNDTEFQNTSELCINKFKALSSTEGKR